MEKMESKYNFGDLVEFSCPCCHNESHDSLYNANQFGLVDQIIIQEYVFSGKVRTRVKYAITHHSGTIDENFIIKTIRKSEKTFAKEDQDSEE